MALQWMFLLLLTPLLAAQNHDKPSPNTYGKSLEKGKCKAPSDWDSRLRLYPERSSYDLNEVVLLRCAGKFLPSVPQIQCISRGAQAMWNETATCKAKCPKPQWDAQLQFSESKTEYPQNTELTLTCPKGLEPSFSKVKCTKEFQRVSSGKPDYVDAWWGRNSRGAWTRIERDVLCMEGCQRPPWDSRLQLVPDQENYEKDEEVNLSCPEGHQPTYTHVKCSSEVQSFSRGKPVYKEVWIGRNSRGVWVRIRSSVECSEILKVGPNNSEISSSSIKLKWTCRFPDACQRTASLFPSQRLSPLLTQASARTSRVLAPNSFLSRAGTGQGRRAGSLPAAGTFPAGTWELLHSSCASCPQLSITARNAADSSVLETERLRLNGSVTELRLPEHSPGSSYAVTIQGLTAAGAGAALAKEFHSSSSSSSSSDTPGPQGISCRSARDIAPWQGTAVLALSPIARGSGAAREHQLLVAPTHNGSVIEGMCSGQPQLLNASVYVAAVLNLSAPTDFVLGDGSRGQGEHNAALRPGCGYTALLRLARRSPQAEKFTCVCYSFSLVAGQTAGQWHGIVIGLVVLLAVLLLTAVILWFVLSRKRKYLPNKTQEDNEKGKGG
ncbi:uncharacterized protein LOC130265501 [Oenanthe melanoleuca]|uniref:uncharacterized protein LOC130265501 n=1 Tax=Oenanthe melanoleuca TaxID=2939378 RepID=UPI0024C16C11|nr:uncharacterized protein LOC130265501 [Oenanthe melanoleuca]